MRFPITLEMVATGFSSPTYLSQIFLFQPQWKQKGWRCVRACTSTNVKAPLQVQQSKSPPKHTEVKELQSKSCCACTLPHPKSPCSQSVEAKWLGTGVLDLFSRGLQDFQILRRKDQLRQMFHNAKQKVQRPQAYRISQAKMMKEKKVSWGRNSKAVKWLPQSSLL